MWESVEDWAYAANWDPTSNNKPCEPSSFGGYPVERTHYTDDMLRVINVLVETSNRKSPQDLGSDDDVLNPQSGTGHVARNVRLGLMLIDLVSPYVYVTEVAFPKPSELIIGWEVGGAFTVDETEVSLKSPQTGEILIQSPIQKGATRWSSKTNNDRGKWPFKTQFQARFDLSALGLKTRETQITLLVRARVDQSWAWNKRTDTDPVGVPPQSHWVNARTNPKWSRSNAGFHVNGKLDWFSEEISVNLTSSLRSTQVAGDGTFLAGSSPSATSVLSMLGIIALVLVGVWAYWRRQTHRHSFAPIQQS